MRGSAGASGITQGALGARFGSVLQDLLNWAPAILSLMRQLYINPDDQA